MIIKDVLPAMSTKFSKPHINTFGAIFRGPSTKHESKSMKARKMDS